jgi:hydroxylaminobenzene mutase
MMQAQSNWLIWNGVLIFFLGNLFGFAIHKVANPRMGVSAHLVAVTAGSFLILMGLVWPRLKLTPMFLQAAYWLLLLSSYSNYFVTFLASIWGTHSLTPVHGGKGAAHWRETLVTFGFIFVIVSVLGSLVPVLWGLWPF